MNDEARNVAPLDMSGAMYDDLRRLARSCLGYQRVAGTMDTTTLVHETYLKLVGNRDFRSDDRTVVLQTAGCAMRSVIVDHARRRTAKKRQAAGSRVPLDDVVEELERCSVEMVVLDDVLNRLASVDFKLVRLVELRFFGQLTIDETAAALEVSTSTVKRDWRIAKMWLRQELSGESGNGEESMEAG